MYPLIIALSAVLSLFAPAQEQKDSRTLRVEADVERELFMAADLSVTFTGLRFQNPFLLSSAPPTESDSNILRAFDAGWGGVVTKTVGLHPVANVAGPKTKFLRADVQSYHLSTNKRPNSALHSSWNWELISDKPLDWWLPRIHRIKQAHPDRILVASIMSRATDAPGSIVSVPPITSRLPPIFAVFVRWSDPTMTMTSYSTVPAIVMSARPL